MQMKKLMYSIVCISLAIISCGLSSTIPAAIAVPVPGVNKEAHIYTTPQEMVITAGSVYVRAEPEGKRVSYRLQGDIVNIYSVEVVNDYAWCRLTPDGRTELWIACWRRNENTLIQTL